MTICGDTVVFSNAPLVETLSRLSEQEREMLYLSFAAGVLDSLMPWSDAYRQYEKKLKAQNLAMCQNLFPVPEAPRTPGKRDRRTVDHEINSLSECGQIAV